MLYRSYVSEYKTDVVEVGTAVSNTDHQPVIVITMFAPSCLALSTREHLTYLYNFLDLREDDEKTRIILRRTEGRPLVRFVESTKLDHEMRVQIALEFLKKIVVYDHFPNSIKKKLLSEDQVFLSEEGVQLQEIVNFTNRDPVSDQEVIARIGHILAILLPDSNEIELALINQMRHSREYSTIREAYEAFRDVFVYQVPVTLEQRIIVNSASLPKITSEMIDSYQAEQEQRRRNEERLAEERRLREQRAEEERKRAEQFQEFNEKIEYQTKLSLSNADFAPSAFLEKEIPLSATDEANPYIPSSQMDYYGISLVKRDRKSDRPTPNQKAEAQQQGDRLPSRQAKTEEAKTSRDDIYETVAGEIVSEGSTGASWNPDLIPPSAALDRDVPTDEIRLMSDGEKQQQIQDALQSITNRFKALFEETVHTTFDVEKPREPEPFVDPFAHLFDGERPGDADNEEIEEEEVEESVAHEREQEVAHEQEYELDDREQALDDRESESDETAFDQPEDRPQLREQEILPAFDEDFETDPYEEVTVYDHHWTDDIGKTRNHSIEEDDEEEFKFRPFPEDEFSPESSFKDELDDFYDSHDRELIRKRQLKRTMLLVLVAIITAVVLFFAYRAISVMLEPLEPRFEITRQSESKVAFTNTSTGASKAHSYLWEVYYGGKLIRSSQDINLILEFKLEGEYLIRLSAENKDGTIPTPFEQTFQFKYGQ